MKEKDGLIKVYTGNEISILSLKDILEEAGISSMVQDDYKLGIQVGFAGGVQSAIDLFIQQTDYQKAEPIIKEFLKNSHDESQ